jgi:hypothetical protein
MPSIIRFEKTTDAGTFSRYVPFNDGRELIVRRGGEMGFSYGLELSRRMVEVDGRPLPLVRFRAILSPPPLMPGASRMNAEAAERYRPVFDVLFLADAEMLMHRQPDGFSDEQVETVLRGISLE